MQKKHLYLFLLIWAIINLAQSALTELFHDEAHWWMFSQHLEWGFWDHPPAAPFLIFLGYEIFPNELGVRLFTVLSSLTTIYLIWDLIRPKDSLLFFGLLSSIFIFHIGGFMVAPDIPLILTTALFFWLYQRYADNDDWRIALLLGLVIAGMAYSKYHGAIVLFFTLLGNWRILGRKSFYLIPVLALLLYLPHLYWQYANDFPTFRYHLVDRGQDTYEWRFIPDYIGGQLLILGPLVSIPLLIAGFRYRPTNPFERSLKWAMAGVLGFFLFRSFSERTEANWTVTAVIPLLYLAYHFLENRPTWRRWILGLAVPTWLLILVFRLFLIWNFVPALADQRNEFHGWDRWAEDIEAIAQDRPVVFYNTYRGPSKYQFYAQKFAHAINVWGHSGNQYDLMPEQEEQLQGKEVMLVGQWISGGTPFSPGGLQDTKYKIVEDFRSYSRVRIKIEDPPHQLPADTTVEVSIQITNPTANKVDFAASSRPVELHYHVYQKNIRELSGKAIPQLPKTSLMPGETIHAKVQLQTPETPGSYRYRFAFHVVGLHNGRNANFYDLLVD
jgi:hypothetical protein